MKLDKKTVNRLLTLNDERLSGMIRGIAEDAGIDPSLLGLNPENIQELRRALESATQEDLDQLTQTYECYRQQKE